MSPRLWSLGQQGNVAICSLCCGVDSGAVVVLLSLHVLSSSRAIRKKRRGRRRNSSRGGRKGKEEKENNDGDKEKKGKKAMKTMMVVVIMIFQFCSPVIKHIPMWKRNFRVSTNAALYKFVVHMDSWAINTDRVETSFQCIQ